MAIDIFKTLEIIEVVENYVERIRPEEDIRNEIDISYRIEDQSVIIYEIRPGWTNKTEILNIDVAKTTYVKSTNNWKIFWKRASGLWESYKPKATVKTIAEFVQIVEEDKHSCFWG
jgi:Protein of unknown function (DUF3024)